MLLPAGVGLRGGPARRAGRLRLAGLNIIVPAAPKPEGNTDFEKAPF